MQVNCKHCGQVFIISGPGCWLCPTCRGQNMIGHQTEKNNNLAAIIVLCICGALLFIVLLIVGAVSSALSDLDEESSYSAESFGEYGNSLQSEIARDYIMNDLPAGQRNAILNGGGSSEDQANAMANLMKSGNLEGAAELLQEY